jgi:class 3 adenylate cyclase/pimeloyl-ACP methyl ester carboxylesterase
VERRLVAILAADVAGYSRLMGVDERGTLAALQERHSAIVAPAIARHRGRIVKLMGDGLLAEFGSVVEAVECAAEIQEAVATRDAPLAADRRMALRIGVHLGDVMADGDDIFGDGVNIAARLEGIAEPGGICISRQAYDQVDGKLNFGFRGLGPRTLKNIARPVEVFAVDIGGAEGPRPATESAATPSPTQDVRYCRASDGVRIAYAAVGTGPPLVKTANWLNHLEYDWESPVWRHFLHRLARDHTLIRYDARGNGLSDWDVDHIDFNRWVDDLETVVEASGVDKFPLLGISQGCAVSVAYAVRHPDRVSHLVLYGGYALGWRRAARTAAERQEGAAMLTLMRLGWGKPNATFRQLYTSQFVPDGTKEQTDWFNELQRRTTSPECATRYLEVLGDIDVRDLIGKIAVPTLVMHARDDARVPFEAGRRLAAGIPGARFVALEGRNHLFLEGEPASARFFEEMRLFLAQ